MKAAAAPLGGLVLALAAQATRQAPAGVPATGCQRSSAGVRRLLDHGCG